MEFLEMKKLESEVKGLQNLMREVHRNQVELNRVLLNRNAYTRSSVRIAELEMMPERGQSKNAPETVQVLRQQPSKSETPDNPPKGRYWSASATTCGASEGPLKDMLIERDNSLHLEKKKSASPSRSSSQERTMRAIKDSPSNSPSTSVQPIQQQPGSPRGNVSGKSSIRNSSFIRNILNEDSRAGIAIIDLFLTVKMAKDNLLFLSQSNTEAFNMIHQLKTETAAVGKGYRNLLEDMQQLLGRMNETITHRISPDVSRDRNPNKNAIWEMMRGKREEVGESSQVCQTAPTSLNSEAQTADSDETMEVDSHGQLRTIKFGSYWTGGLRTDGSMIGSSGCLSCFVNSHKEALFRELPDLTEASLTTFMGTLLRLQKGNQSVCEECKTSSRNDLRPTERGSEGNMSLSDSSFRLFCDICEVLDGVTREDLECDTSPKITRMVTEDVSVAPSAMGPKYPPVTDETIEDPPGGASSSQAAVESSPDCLSCRRKSSKREAAVETEFDDQSTYLLGAEPNAKPSVTCMGDLTRAVPGRKNVSTLTTANSILTYRKLSTEMRTKLKRKKSKGLKLEQKKSEKGSLKPLRRVKVGEGTSAEGLRDITDEYNKIRDLECPTPRRKAVQVSSASGPDSASAATEAPKGDDYMSEDSYYNCDSAYEDSGSDAGDEELEEFVEIYNQKSRTVGTDDISTQENMPITSALETAMVPLTQEYALAASTYERSIALCEDLRDETDARELGPRKTLLGFLHTTTLKTIRALFFEIQKCYPANFVQEILPKTIVESPNRDAEDRSISLCPGENKQKRIVIEGSSTDFVIYIQVEMDGGSKVPSQSSLDQRASTLGTQTRMLTSPNVAPEAEKEIKPEAEEDDVQSLCDVWEECDGGRWADLEESDEVSAATETEKEKRPVSRDRKDRGRGLDTLDKAIREVFVDKNWGVKLKKGKVTKGTMAMIMQPAVQQADVWYQHSSLERMSVLAGRDFSAVTSETTEMILPRPPELEKALKLIREVENDIADVKLSEAISILPRLEWELRKHLRGKIKNLEERETGNDIADVSFFSSLDLWPEEEDSSEVGNREASERMRNLLMMLTELEEAIKSSESAGYSGTLCQYDSSKVYKLLRLLVASIQGLEGDASVASLSQTLDIASQLDTAVREYDSIVRRRPLDYLSPDGGKGWKNTEVVERVPEKQHLKNVRKKVFQAVETEAIQLERRVERDFGRMGPLERENDEAMVFLEAFLQKTERRLTELNGLKSDILKLSSWISDMHDNLLEKIVQKRLKREAEVETVKKVIEVKHEDESRESTRPSSPKEVVVRETVSGLLQALDRLKSRAREKNQLCKEILSPKFSERLRESGNSSRRSSRSSFTAKHAETLTSSLKTFRKIGPSSLYLSWSSPEGSLRELVTGYEIYLNGKLNQKVRSSRRLQAVLYSVDFSKGIDLELYAIAEGHPKTLLISEHYQEE